MGVRTRKPMTIHWKGSIVLWVSEVVASILDLFSPLTILGWLRGRSIPMWLVDLWVLALIAIEILILFFIQPLFPTANLVFISIAIYSLVDVIATAGRDFILATDFHVDEEGGYIGVRNRTRWLVLTMLTAFQVIISFAILIFASGNGFYNKVADPITALYISAVTFTTVGFGDHVPIYFKTKSIIISEIGFFLLFLTIKVPIAVSMIRVKKMEDNENMDRTNSMGLWRYAKAYSEAGRVVIENLKRAIAPSPAYYLYCHAIELALKAYLRGSGSTLSELKHIGHDLSKSYQRALIAGIKDVCNLTPDMEASINLANKVYRDKEFEYIKIGVRTIPTIEILRETTELLVARLEKYCYEMREAHN